MAALDGLRGLAILIVLAHHAGDFAHVAPQGALERGVATVLAYGWVGVDLFFALSGYLITGILLRARCGCSVRSGCCR